MELLLLLWGGNKRDLHLTRCKMDLGETIFCLNESNSLWTEVGKYGIMREKGKGKDFDGETDYRDHTSMRMSNRDDRVCFGTRK